MGVAFGGGWELVHLTDRVLQLRKPCPIRRRMGLRDGVVTVRAEPDMTRHLLFERAREAAQRDDAAVAALVARDILPSNVRRFQMQQHTMTTAVAVPGEEPAERIYRP